MANIHSVQSEGSAIQLGPVTVSKTYEMKPGDKQRYVKVRDASGETGLKIWGPTSGTPLVEGQVITLVGMGPRGGVKNQEYPAGSGKWTLNANDCRLEIGGQAPPQGYSQPQAYVAHQEPAPAPQTVPAYPVPQTHAAPSGDKLEATMKRAAQATALYIDELVVNHGFSKDEAIMLAQNAGSYWPLYWFGEKGV
jgi:hypothetical protein